MLARFTPFDARFLSDKTLYTTNSENCYLLQESLEAEKRVNLQINDTEITLQVGEADNNASDIKFR